MSKDSSIKVNAKFMKKDDRIILLKNNINSGTFYTRFVGLIFSKGYYIAFADSDDFFLPDLFGNAYNAAIKNNLKLSSGLFQKNMILEMIKAGQNIIQLVWY